MKVRPRNSSCSTAPFNTGIAFTELSDTPDSYLGHAGQFIVVNNNENGIEFSNSSTGLNFADFIAVDDVYPVATIRGQLFRSLNFATYNGNGYPPDTLFLALANNPTSAQWKIW